RPSTASPMTRAARRRRCSSGWSRPAISAASPGAVSSPTTATRCTEAEMTTWSIVDTGGSRSFPAPHPFLEGASREGEVTVYIGTGAVAAFRHDPSKVAVLVELGTGSLGEATGEAAGTEGSNAVGFARFR